MPNDPFANGTARSARVRQRERKPREITGRMVFGMMVAFFAVVIGVNVFMAHEALSTFGGVETESAYQAGQKFERDVAMAKVQDAQHWQVDAKVSASR